MRQFIKCDCGIVISTNTWKKHLTGKNCSLSLEKKSALMSIIECRTKNRSAWLISEGVEAIKDSKWFRSVLEGHTKIEDWQFTCPRISSAVRPSSAKNFQRDRKGSRNPSIVVHSPDYILDDIKLFAKECAAQVIINKEPFRSILKIVEAKYPKFQYMLADVPYIEGGRGFNKDNKNLAFLLDLTIDEIIALNTIGRGQAISKGQLSSEKFRRFASEHASKLVSGRWRVSKPQRILFAMIKSVDEDAILEYYVNYEGLFKSYDIWSPKLNAVIEMYGHVFHDIAQTKPGLLKICQKNVANDAVKKCIAQNNGWQYIVFWDNQQYKWFSSVASLYNQEPMSHEDACDSVYEEDRENACLRHGNAPKS